MARVAFALKMIWARFDPEKSCCPYCSSKFYTFMQRKKLLVQARKCLYCGLMYRWPVDRRREIRSFYQRFYQGQQATEIPEREKLKQLMQNKFRGSIWDKTHRLDFLRSLVNYHGTLLDFGCSWGYGTCQYADLGLKVTGLEIDKDRASFGRLHLGLDVRSEWKEFEDRTYFDVILADHTLEHLSNLREVLEEFRMHSRAGTKLIIFVPNGSGRAARFLGVKWGPFIGEAHTVAFTMEWFSKNLPRHCFYPRFYTGSGEPLPVGEYLSDEEEITLIATREEY